MNMKKLMLEDLKLVIPTVDILETRSLFGGSGVYDDKPYIPPIPGDGENPDDPNRPDNIDPLPIPELPVPDVEVPEIDPDYVPVPGGDDSSGNDDERENDDSKPDDDRDPDDGNGYSDGDDGRGSGSSNGGDNSPSCEGNCGCGCGDMNIGNPHNPNNFPTGRAAQIGDMCVTEAIGATLAYMGVNMNINQLALEVAKLAGLTGVVMGKWNAQTYNSVFNHFFDLKPIQEMSDVTEALLNGNVIFSSIGDIKDGHQIVITGIYSFDAANNRIELNYYDPTTGNVEHGTTENFNYGWAVSDLNPNFKSDYIDTQNHCDCK
jgi:hypothetical protein